MKAGEFFTEYGEAGRYEILEVIGKGSYGIVCSALDRYSGEKVAIKKINGVFDHISDATRILREIKLLRYLRHPDIVQIKHIMLPPSKKAFKDIFVVFELMETDLHQVIKANNDLTPGHLRFFLYQMLRGLKYVHTANVFHRDLKPKNILANSDCKLKLCDFGLARPAFSDHPQAIFWTDYVATRWYRAPELCGSFFAKYSPAVDIWSIGCIFAEVILRKPLFPGRNVAHQLELITDFLGSPSVEEIEKVRNEKAKRFLIALPKKKPVRFEDRFPELEPKAVSLLKRLLSFDPLKRPSAAEALEDAYFEGMHRAEHEPSANPVSKFEYDFERRKVTMIEVREAIYREILEYHPQMKLEYFKHGGLETGMYLYPSAVENFKRQFAALEEKSATKGNFPPESTSVRSSSVPIERVQQLQEAIQDTRRDGHDHADGAVVQGKTGAVPADAVHSDNQRHPSSSSQAVEVQYAAYKMQQQLHLEEEDVPAQMSL